MRVAFNGVEYDAIYNSQTGVYEVALTAPSDGGIYEAQIKLGDDILASKKIQVLAKQEVKLDMTKVFMWIFDYTSFEVKDIIEIADYELIIDEETNAKSTINVIKRTTAKAKDIVAIKRNGKIVYWGTIDNISNINGENEYEYTVEYITNIFNQNIILEDESLISSTGIEDFIASAIDNNFISNSDTFVNKDYLVLDVKTHTPKQISVSNVENNIYNLHTWITNCTQNYDIVYDFSIVDKKLVIGIESKTLDKQLIDVQAQAVSDYEEVFEIDVVSKVIVLTSTNTYTLYLLNDRTTTTDGTDPNRAEGRVETVYTENYEDAPQVALDTLKANSYNHNITFSFLNRWIPIGTPIAIKTKESLIFNTYISSVRITQNSKIEYQCGNIRINFIEKIKQGAK